MSMTNYSHGLTVRAGHAISHTVASWVAADDTAPPTTQPAPDAAIIAQAADLFAQALCDNSNLEADWLWLATQVTREHERRYCLQRALHINPDSSVARRALRRLSPLPEHIARLHGHA